jgi:flagellar biosynthetic protein FlhB
MPGERTEQATQHRRDKARKEGDLLHSRELSAAAGTLAGVIALGMLGSETLFVWRGAFSDFLALGDPGRWEPAQLQPTLFAFGGSPFPSLRPWPWWPRRWRWRRWGPGFFKPAG